MDLKTRPGVAKPGRKATNRRNLALVGAAGLLLVIWGFVLGILVGRGTVPKIVSEPPVKPKVETESPLTQEKQASPATQPAPPTTLSFYRDLAQTTPNQGSASGQAEASSPPPSLGKPAKTPAAEKPAPKADQPSPKAAKPEPAKTEPNRPTQTKAEGPARYTLQVAAFKSKAEAEAFAQRAAKTSGLSATVVTADLGDKGTWHRVRLGGFANREEAQVKAKELRAKGLQALVAPM